MSTRSCKIVEAKPIDHCAGKVRTLVVEKIKAGWSPEQISGRLSLENKDPLSHESIYKFIKNDCNSGGISLMTRAQIDK
ncbi:MAG: hypothetical protein IPK04_08835 [Bdellovibrionales bacterium]|nr:hypothetical protein [Bdellovibrionales bacterium]